MLLFSTDILYYRYEDYIDMCEALGEDPVKEDSQEYWNQINNMINDEFYSFKEMIHSYDDVNPYKFYIITGSCQRWTGLKGICPVIEDSLFSAIMRSIRGYDDFEISLDNGEMSIIGIHHDGRDHLRINKLNGNGSKWWDSAMNKDKEPKLNKYWFSPIKLIY